MPSNEGFRFKQFYVHHDRCAMKVGTDGVLLGAWAPGVNGVISWLNRGQNVVCLDIGTGSGLVALMLAQRFPQAKIEAIDIDSNAVQQAQENFEQSAFCNQLSVHQARLQDWHGGPYDLIVSNPPYFQNSLKNPDKGRELARHTDNLSYEELIAHSARLLNPEGQLAIILPAETEKDICRMANDMGLCLTHITRVFSKESKPARRVLMSFCKNTTNAPIEDTLVLENDKGDRSRPYQELCKDFYL